MYPPLVGEPHAKHVDVIQARATTRRVRQQLTAVLRANHTTTSVAEQTTLQ